MVFLMILLALLLYSCVLFGFTVAWLALVLRRGLYQYLPRTVATGPSHPISPSEIQAQMNHNYLLQLRNM